MIARHVAFVLGGGRVARCVPGSLLGRAPGASLRFDDVAVSEAHALVSWRDGKLRLLALRGQVQAGGKQVAEVTLRRGLEIQLSRDTKMIVNEVVLPPEVLCIEGVDGGAAEVEPPVASVVGDPPRLVPGLCHDAHLWLWTEGATWYARARGGEAGPVRVGQAWPAAGQVLRGLAVAAGQAGAPTRASSRVPVRVVVEPGVVRVVAEGAPALVLGGNQAEFLALLATAQEPQHWSTVAHYFWGERDREKWRERFDAMVKEVRGKFRDHRVRGDLLWSWDGNYRLNLEDGDELVVPAS